MALTAVLTGCATAPVALAPVGPNPNGPQYSGNNGQLLVYSALIGRVEGDNPTWHQHMNYTIYNQQDMRVMHVINKTGYYARAPRLVSLPPGNYLVKAEASDFTSVEVPVVIVSGRITRVHLDGTWHPTTTGQVGLVDLPTGDPVGWSTHTK